jgi:hypothetical protein
VKQAKGAFTDAKNQTERWIQAVTLPLEVQMKDHKAQLQSRLDNLAKINEKTTTINEQMALLRTAEAELRKQREMIDGLIVRVSQHEKRATLEAELPPPVARPELTEPVEFFRTTKMQAAAPAKPAPKPAAARPAPSPAPAAAPMVSDDMLAQLGAMRPLAQPAPGLQPAGASFDPLKTQKLGPESERTQRIDPTALAEAERTQRLDAERTQRLDAERTQRIDAERTQRIDAERTQRIEPARAPAHAADGDKTMKIAALDPAYKPGATQPLEAARPAGPDPEATQPLDDSIWKLQEAKRILKGIREKQD